MELMPKIITSTAQGTVWLRPVGIDLTQTTRTRSRLARRLTNLALDSMSKESELLPVKTEAAQLKGKGLIYGLELVKWD